MSTTEAPERRYRIAEVSRLTGFTPTALRYYENAGVLAPPERTAAGYRAYDDRALERLRLVARAKELGCSLEEVAGLVEAWESDDCGPVKHRLRSLVNAKVIEVERHIEEQVVLAAQLRATATSLAGRPVEGRCDDTCGCTSVSPAHVATETEDVARCGPGCSCGAAASDAVMLVTRDEAVRPIACSLNGGDMQERIAEWQALLSEVERREAVPGGLRLAFGQPAPLSEMARLAEAEQKCCAFFSFSLAISSRGVALEVTAPSDGQPLLEAVFGVAT